MLENILERKSVRKYTDQPIEKEKVELILQAGMSGPTAVNARPWSFIVVDDKEVLAKMADANGRAAGCLKDAALGILICGDLDRAFERAPEYWVIDGAIAGQNMILAARELGIGSVWLGTWPQEGKVANQKELFNLPDSIIPHSIIAFGYPDGDFPDGKSKLNWEEDRVHYNGW